METSALFGSKQPTTNERIANGDKKRIEAYKLRKAIRRAKQQLIEESLTESERQSLEKEIKSMERKCKTYDTQSRSVIPKNLAKELQRELYDIGAHSPHPLTGGAVGNVVVAEFQADSFMASQIIENKASMVMSKDADIPILCGDCCIEIKQFTKGGCEIVCTSESTLKNVMKYLPKETNAVLNKAECPIFDGIQTPRLRALMMLILGCDVYGPGMKGTKAKKLVPLIESFQTTTETELYQKLFKEFKTANELDDLVIDTYIDALLYEPTNAVPDTRKPILFMQQRLYSKWQKKHVWIMTYLSMLQSDKKQVCRLQKGMLHLSRSQADVSSVAIQ